MHIDKMLLKLRKKANLSKKELTDRLNIKYTTYANYESGIREPNSDFLIKIAKFYEVSVDYILGLTDLKINGNKNIVFNNQELDLIKKYRKLDNYSKKIVDTIIDLELKR